MSSLGKPEVASTSTETIYEVESDSSSTTGAHSSYASRHVPEESDQSPSDTVSSTGDNVPNSHEAASLIEHSDDKNKTKRVSFLNASGDQLAGFVASTSYYSNQDALRSGAPGDAGVIPSTHYYELPGPGQASSIGQVEQHEYS